METKIEYIGKTLTSIAICTATVIGMWLTGNAWISLLLFLVPLTWATNPEGGDHD